MGSLKQTGLLPRQMERLDGTPSLVLAAVSPEMQPMFCMATLQRHSGFRWITQLSEACRDQDRGSGIDRSCSHSVCRCSNSYEGSNTLHSDIGTQATASNVSGKKKTVVRGVS